MDKKFEVTFLGTNGSCAYNNGKRRKYGTNTLCTLVRAGETMLLFDLGSGIVGLKELKMNRNKEKHLFFSHYHLDHISGLLFCSDFFDPDQQIHLYGGGDDKNDFRDILEQFLSPPHHPVGFEVFKAKIRFHPLTAGMRIPLPGGVSVHTYQLSHTGAALGYRVEYDGKALCLCMDVELANHQNDDGLVEFTRNADLLVLDSFFGTGVPTPGWGHSNTYECAEWAARVNAKMLALSHYHYTYTDDDIDAMELTAREIFPKAFASADFMQVTL